MSLRRWKKIDGHIAHENPWWSYRRDIVELPSGNRGEYHFVHTPGSVMLLPRQDDGDFVLVRQYRYLNDRESIEFPAGGIKQGQTAVEAAAAELREEAGLEAGELRELGRYNPFNGVTDEFCIVSLATALRPCRAQPDDTEEFEILRLGPDAIESCIADGSIWDGMSMAAWAMYRALNREDV